MSGFINYPKYLQVNFTLIESLLESQVSWTMQIWDVFHETLYIEFFSYIVFKVSALTWIELIGLKVKKSSKSKQDQKVEFFWPARK